MAEDSKESMKDDGPETTSKPGGRGGLSRNKKIAIGIAAGLFVLVGILLVWMLVPAKPESFNDPVSVQQQSQNAAVYAALSSTGIDAPFVDITDDRAYVAYEVPPSGNLTNVTQSEYRASVQRFVLGVAAEGAPNAKVILVVQYVDQKPVEAWSVKAEDYKAFREGRLDAAGFEAKIEKTTL